jgi:hypothetical protein
MDFGQIIEADLFEPASKRENWIFGLDQDLLGPDVEQDFFQFEQQPTGRKRMAEDDLDLQFVSQKRHCTSEYTSRNDLTAPTNETSLVTSVSVPKISVKTEASTEDAPSLIRTD